MNKFGGIFFTTFFMLLISAIAANNCVKRAFVKHEVVPDVIPIAPKQKLKITYGGGLEVNYGNELTPTQVKSQPKLKWRANADSFYTVIMIDPDALSRKEPTLREFKHWIVGNIPGTNVGKGDVLAAYIGAAPPQGTGLHRYVFLAYKQPAKIEFKEVRVGNDSREGRPKFKSAEFAKKYGLGDPVAGNFYQAQNA